jgi:transposase
VAAPRDVETAARGSQTHLAPDRSRGAVGHRREHVPELRAFAGGLRRDIAAVTAALEWDWSNGQTEGHINKLKLLARRCSAGQRAGFGT